MENSNVIRFSTLIKNDDYIVRDHRVHGVRIMPGVTFLDMIYRGLIANGLPVKNIELRNILFKEPVSTTEEYDKKIEITVEKIDDHGIITAKSQKVKNGRKMEAEWSLNLKAELHFSNEVLSNMIDLEWLIRHALKEVDMDEAYGFARKIEINHYDFMKAPGRIYAGDG